MFTTEHYIAIAEVLASHNVDPEHCPDCERKDEMLGLLAYDLAEMFAADNPRFSRDRFYTACSRTTN